MKTVEQAFREGMRLVREAGLPIKGTDIPLIVAHGFFQRDCCGKESDPRFDDQAPLHAKNVILRCYAPLPESEIQP